ncbi:XRE family transcriptional regulator [Vibrio tritonius]|uniref:helix-turn-helix domain-containing protein n=1 Tax=Vibrio tritonius TaxID=1435069 RepID=UPI00315D9865
MTQETDGVLEYVAANVKRLRAQHNLSQQALADKSGISRRMVAGLENGSTNISLAKLAQLAAVLGVSFAQIVSPSETESHHRNILTWRGTHPESKAVLCCSLTATQQVELWMWSLAPNDGYLAEPDPEGWHELLHIIDGELTLELSDGTHLLVAGDSLVYSSAQTLRYQNNGSTLLRFVRSVVGGS